MERRWAQSFTRSPLLGKRWKRAGMIWPVCFHFISNQVHQSFLCQYWKVVHLEISLYPFFFLKSIVAQINYFLSGKVITHGDKKVSSIKNPLWTLKWWTRLKHFSNTSCPKIDSLENSILLNSELDFPWNIINKCNFHI